MSGTTSVYTTPSLSAAASAAASSQLATGSTSNSTSGTNALAKLSSNYNDFLQMLMTQLKNQDPSSPMDANSFTQELVQFSGVEQQINTNTSLSQLIQLTQDDGLLQSSAMVGKQVSVANSDMPVQNGTGSIQFTVPANEQVAISVSDSSGNLLSQSTVNATQGSNTWHWNATSGNGTSEPDGDYKVTVTTTNATGATSNVAFNAIGTVTGVVSSGTGLNVQMGAVSDPLSNVQSVIN
jgi:flagellar basal-body rod modification protein FlgD